MYQSTSASIQNTIDQVAWTTECPFSWFWRMGSPKSRCQHGRLLGRALFLVCRQLPSHSVFTWGKEMEGELSGVSSFEGTNPIIWVGGSWSHLKVPISKYHHYGVIASTYKLVRGTQFSPIAGFKVEKWSTLSNAAEKLYPRRHWKVTTGLCKANCVLDKYVLITTLHSNLLSANGIQGNPVLELMKFPIQLLSQVINIHQFKHSNEIKN